MSLVPQAKIAVPQLPPELVVRAALRADLDTASRADVALVCAPPGYGKTMLLADWAHTSTGSDRSDTAWVSLDRDDNDPKRLWTSVVGRARRLPVGATGQPPARPLDCGAPAPNRSSSPNSPTPCSSYPGRSG